MNGFYQGKEGGLYPGGGDAPPPAHLAGGLAQAAQIVARAASGAPSPNGKIGFVTIGMSNTLIESNAFITNANANPYKNPALVAVNCAESGNDAAIISNPNAPYWNYVDAQIAAAGLTKFQVQAAWLKEGVGNITLPFPQDSDLLKTYLIAIVQILHNKFPNVRICYLSSRIYGGYATVNLSPEPYAYQSGFGVKDLIAAQIAGDPNLNYDIAAGPVKSPWLAWGPYLWADGTTPRSDGLVWICADFQSDGTHPTVNASGAQKVGSLLLKFMLTDPTASPWFTTNNPVCTSAASASLFGTGVGGAGGVPSITITPPKLGTPQSVVVSLAGAPANANVYFAFGYYSYNDGSLPFAGGWQHMSADAILQLQADANGGVQLSFGPLALDPALCGLQLFAQIATEDSSAPGGFGLTPGLAFRFGL